MNLMNVKTYDWRLVEEQPDDNDRVCACGAPLDSAGRCVEWREHEHDEYEE